MELQCRLRVGDLEHQPFIGAQMRKDHALAAVVAATIVLNALAAAVRFSMAGESTAPGKGSSSPMLVRRRSARGADSRES